MLLAVFLYFYHHALAEDTIFAAQFSEEGFESLHCAMTAGEVTKVLGQPLYKTNHNAKGKTVEIVVLDKRVSIKPEDNLEKQPISFSDWFFSMAGPKSDNYEQRILEFDANNNLLRTKSEFYVD